MKPDALPSRPEDCRPSLKAASSASNTGRGGDGPWGTRKPGRRTDAMTGRWDALHAPSPKRPDWHCPVCGAADADDCRAYGPESEACYRYA